MTAAHRPGAERRHAGKESFAPGLLRLDSSRGRHTATGLALFAVAYRLVGLLLALPVGPTWFVGMQAMGAAVHGLSAWRAHRLQRVDSIFLYSKGSEWSIWALGALLAYGPDPSFQLVALLFLSSSILVLHDMPTRKRLALVLIPLVLYFPVVIAAWDWGTAVQLAPETVRVWAAANQVIGTAVVVVMATLAIIEHARARREAETQARISADLVEDLSHELRTPIATMLTASQGTKAATAPEALRESLGWIEDSARSAGRLVVRMLDLAALERGEISNETQPLPLLEVVQAATNRFQPLAKEREVELRFEANLENEHAANQRRVDPGSLDIVLHNLLSNALAHSPTGSRVVVRVIEEEPVRIEVEDRGDGIAPEDLSRVFDRLWRADRARSREQGRHGLGLAIARRHALLLGADLEVRSQLGAGSTFTVVFR